MAHKKIFFLIVVLIPFSCSRFSNNHGIKDQIVKIESERVIQQANIYLVEVPVTVTDTFCVRSTGNTGPTYRKGDWNNRYHSFSRSGAGNTKIKGSRSIIR